MTAWNVRPALVAMALSVSLAGCAEEPARTAEPTPTPTTQTPSDPETTATPTPTVETETPTPTVDPVVPRSISDRLLPAEQLPGFNEVFTWKVGSTAAGEPEDGIQCQRFSLLSIGGMEAAHRTYLAADGSAATGLEVVVDFPDAKTAKGAYSVLQSWYRDCPRDHDGDPHVGLSTAVPLPTAGAASWYLLTYGTTFDAHGLVRRGSRLAVVVLTLPGAQDYNYEPGQEPMVAALQQAATLL